VTDISETPAVPPTDPGGDERLGLQIAGLLLMVLGFGVGTLANLAAHMLAGPGGSSVGPWTVHTALGPFAWALLLLGFFTGLIGIAFLVLARDAPKGPVVLPGYPY
jgi:hypothetical protein